MQTGTTGSFSGPSASYLALSAVTMLGLALLCSIWPAGSDISAAIALMGLFGVYMASTELIVLFMVFALASILVDFMRGLGGPHSLSGRGWLIFLQLLAIAAKAVGSFFAWSLWNTAPSAVGGCGGYAGGGSGGYSGGGAGGYASGGDFSNSGGFARPPPPPLSSAIGGGAVRIPGTTAASSAYARVQDPFDEAAATSYMPPSAAAAPQQQPAPQVVSSPARPAQLQQQPAAPNHDLV